MGYIDLFEDTCNNSIGGIKKLYLATRYSDGSPIDFPIMYYLIIVQMMKMLYYWMMI